jgi:hypothetical protein
MKQVERRPARPAIDTTIVVQRSDEPKPTKILISGKAVARAGQTRRLSIDS